jgi:sterol desaturase/sphingolipid hydroxylase (fatty acid hydroxylase superfamily)
MANKRLFKSKWSLTAMTYYADFILIPTLMAASALSVWLVDADKLTVAHCALLGFMIWQVAEWAIHKYVFHRWYKREHWAHHQRPGAFIGVPPWFTAGPALVGLCVLLTMFSAAVAHGLFLGIAAGYLLYIYVHDRIHHDPLIHEPGVSIWHSAYKRHSLHHRGIEGNYCVALPFVDMLFGTYIKT